MPAWLDNSYTQLAVEAVGFVVAALLLRALLGRRLALAAGTTVVVALLLTLRVVPGVWGDMRGLEVVRDGLILAPGLSEREKCLVDGGHPEAVGLSRFVIKRVPSDARLAVSGSIPQVCFQLTLLPRVMVNPDEPHQYTLYAGNVPASVRARMRAERSLEPAMRTVESYKRNAVLVREG